MHSTPSTLDLSSHSFLSQSSTGTVYSLLLPLAILISTTSNGLVFATTIYGKDVSTINFLGEIETLSSGYWISSVYFVKEMAINSEGLLGKGRNNGGKERKKMPAVRNCLRRGQTVAGRLLGGRTSTSRVSSVNCNHINRMNLTVDKIGSS